jgi:hypothetical protein
MKTIALISLIILTGLLLAPTSQAAPSCCAQTQGQGQAGVFQSAPVGQTATIFPVAQRNAYMPPVPQTRRQVAQRLRNRPTSQPPAASYRGPLIQVQPISMNPSIAPVAAAPGGCGCGRFQSAAYPAPSRSCCSGRGLNVPRQVIISSGSVPSCCAGNIRAAAPASSCCAGKVKDAPRIPSCCAAGPKTVGPAPRLAEGSLNAPNPYLPLQALPAAIPVRFQSNMASAMRIPSNGAPVLRLGSLW